MKYQIRDESVVEAESSSFCKAIEKFDKNIYTVGVEIWWRPNSIIPYRKLTDYEINQEIEKL
jgi:hypothetical protein